MTGGHIELRGLRLLARCGAGASERETPQPLELDLEITADLSRAGDTDVLADTVDYGDLCDVVAASVVERPAALLEHLAHRAAGEVLAADPRIEAVTVAVRKLRPPVAHDIASAGVRVTRRR